ncbi:glycosyl transferase family 1 [Pilimelia terevasa]|uniref:Glycosyl transferase family 1 n=1 Tax=Pilimelia terevasa TaxID=53372 RepID=A0A8J3FJH7_9ACTN|nr:glycosyltransferase [Pilimelia terevasa]GGK29167.1 glycosyl transferase family 1 [Pilimelia terevasa]
MAAEQRVVIWRSLLLPGSETFVRDQGGALTRWRPTYVGALRHPSPLARATDVAVLPGGPAGRAGFLALRATGRCRPLRAALRRADPRLVHAHFAGDGWLVARSAAALGLPLVITAHGRDVTSQAAAAGARGARYRRHLREAFAQAALVLAVSRPIAQRVVALGADPARVRVHHTGVPLPAPQPAGPKRWDVVFVGRFVPKKGVDDLLTAAAALADLRPRLLLVGDGPGLPEARRRAAALRLDATFTGACPPADVARHLAGSRLLAAPSKLAPDGDREGLPTTILEAAAHGVPAVATRHSGIPEAVRHGETGLLGPEGDPAALAAHLRALLTDDARCRRLAAAARRHVGAHFDLHTQTARLETLYDEAAG